MLQVMFATSAVQLVIVSGDDPHMLSMTSRRSCAQTLVPGWNSQPSMMTVGERSTLPSQFQSPEPLDRNCACGVPRNPPGNPAFSSHLLVLLLHCRHLLSQVMAAPWTQVGLHLDPPTFWW